MNDEYFEQLLQALNDACDADHPAATIVLARKVLDEDAEDGLTWARLGEALSELANYQEAEAALNNALQFIRTSRRGIVLKMMGHLYQFRGEFDTAMRWYQEVIDHQPDDATGYIYMGAALARLGRLKEAETVHRAATTCKDGCVDEAFHNLGLVLRGQGRYEEARECIAKALEIDPDYAAAREALDDVLEAIACSNQDEV